MGIFSYISDKKKQMRESEEERDKIRAAERKAELSGLKKQRSMLEDRRKIDMEYENENKKIAELKALAPKTGIRKVAEVAGKGIQKLSSEAKKFKSEVQEFKKENPDFGKPRGIFVDNASNKKKKGGPGAGIFG